MDIHLRRGAFMSYQERVKELADLIKRCSRVYALTGVGMSTESGIPDFRSLGPGFLAKMDPERALSLIYTKTLPDFMINSLIFGTAFLMPSRIQAIWPWSAWRKWATCRV